jgi:hypothetical protein
MGTPAAAMVNASNCYRVNEMDPLLTVVRENDRNMRNKAPRGALEAMENSSADLI